MVRNDAPPPNTSCPQIRPSSFFYPHQALSILQSSLLQITSVLNLDFSEIPNSPRVARSFTTSRNSIKGSQLHAFGIPLKYHITLSRTSLGNESKKKCGATFSTAIVPRTGKEKSTVERNILCWVAEIEDRVYNNLCAGYPEPDWIPRFPSFYICRTGCLVSHSINSLSACDKRYPSSRILRKNSMAAGTIERG